MAPNFQVLPRYPPLKIPHPQLLATPGFPYGTASPQTPPSPSKSTRLLLITTQGLLWANHRICGPRSLPLPKSTLHPALETPSYQSLLREGSGIVAIGGRAGRGRPPCKASSWEGEALLLWPWSPSPTGTRPCPCCSSSGLSRDHLQDNLVGCCCQGPGQGH